MCRLIGLTFVIVFTCSRVASFDAGPDQVKASVGEVVKITCLHPKPVLEADWFRVSPAQTSETQISMLSICINGYAVRFSVDVQSNYKLTIRNVTINDTGTYTCVVYDEQEYRHQTRLTVIYRTTDTSNLSNATSTSTGQHSTTAIQQSGGRYVMILAITAAVVVIVVVISALLAYVVIRRKEIKRRSNFPTADTSPAGNANGSDNSTDVLVESNPPNDEVPESGYTSMKTVDEDWLDNEYMKGTYKSSEAYVARVENDDETLMDNTIESIINRKTASLVLSKSFLHIFREYRLSSQDKVSAAMSFTALASVSNLWRVKLTGTRAALRRIRRLVYYECSGYGRRAIAMKPLRSTTDISPVMAVAILNNTIYIVHKDSNTIHVGPDQKGRIIVPGMKYPVDMVACNTSHELYIADEYQRCIWHTVVDELPDKLTDLAGLAPKSLSLRGSSLLITTNSQTILKYLHTGKKLLKIKLPLEPQHAVETSRGTFIASCKSINCNQVVEFDSTGNELHRFVCVAPLLRFPSYVILDRDEQLLVADFVNNRILLLDTKLEHACTLLDQQRDGIAAPQRMCLNERTGELFVVQWPSSSVGVYDVKTLSACAQNVVASV